MSHCHCEGHGFNSRRSRHISERREIFEQMPKILDLACVGLSMTDNECTKVV